MNAAQVVVRGTLKADGSLELNEKPSLPAGPVDVLIRVAPTQAENETWWEYLQREHAELKARGHLPRTKEQIDADRARVAQEDEARRAIIEGARSAKG